MGDQRRFSTARRARCGGGIIQRGGTVLQTRRSKAFMERSGQQQAIGKMREAGIDALVINRRGWFH